jgi:hypothetical protein
MGLHSLLQSFTSFYVDNVRTSQETPMGLHGLLQGYPYFLYMMFVPHRKRKTFTVCYKDNLLYYDVRTSQET